MPSLFKDAHLLAPLPLRLAAAFVFIQTGYAKLFGGLGRVGQYFGGLGIPLSGFSAVLVGVVEFFGGMMLVVGLFTRWVSLLQAAIMVVVIWLVKWPRGLIGGGSDREFLLLALALALLILGSGRLSLDRFLRKRAQT